MGERQRERGAALLVAMLMLMLLGLIGLSALDTVTRDRQVAGYQNLAQTALYAADAGVAQSLEILRTEITGAALAPGDCLTSTLPTTSLGSGVSFGPDSTAATNQICMLGAADPCEGIGGSIEQGQAIYLNTVWNVRVQGQAPGGATSRVQASAVRCHAFNN